MAQKFDVLAVIGEPNAGKSTLVNTLVGQKVSIVSKKPQTTRSNVLGIFLEQEAQIVLTDTPGVFLPRERLGRAMFHGVCAALREAEGVLFVVDASRPQMGRCFSLLKEHPETRSFLVLNKIDRLSRQTLLPLAQTLNAQFPFRETFMISALKQDGIATMKRVLAGAAPEGAWLYPEDQVTNLPLRLLAAELTRERLYAKFSQEIPYACTVETETWEDFTYKKETRIAQNIYIKKASQRPILLGKGGKGIREIRLSVQKELEELLMRRVHLFLSVKERTNWSEDKAFYDLWEMRYDA
ncbi:MAG: GTPase Era [Holosporales bacterium]|jgi:GTP-binding protein Era|nr:GTPase Era [Holosporales bacterium]